MGNFYKWRPSASAKREFARKMAEVDEFCAEHGISRSSSSDSYYFTLNNKRYRVSNHTREASNAKAYDEFTGEKWREFYHDLSDTEEIQIFAGKTRIIQIYNDLVDGYELDGRGYVKSKSC